GVVGAARTRTLGPKVAGARAEGGLAAVDCEQTAHESAPGARVNAPAVTSATRWYLSPRYTQLATMMTLPRRSESIIRRRRQAWSAGMSSSSRTEGSGSTGSIATRAFPVVMP